MNPEDFQHAGPEPADLPEQVLNDVDTAPARTPRRPGRAAAIAGALLIGGGGLIALVGPFAVNAASPSPDPAATSGTGASGASGATTANPDPLHGGRGAMHGPGGPGGFGGPNEAVSDLSVVATAIGVSETDLQTALQSGKTIADVAKANNVDPQKAIDALVQDGQDELAAAVKAGTLTQAQADAEKANVTQRATDQVNGTFRGDMHGPGGPGGFGGMRGHGPRGGPTGNGSTGSGSTASPTATPTTGG